MTKIQTKQLVIGFLLLVVTLTTVTILTRTWMQNQQKRLVTEITQKISEQELKISNHAALMSTASVDQTVERLFVDCRERNRFDTLLDALSTTMPIGELNELSAMYDRCASYFPNRRLVMVARFEREVEVLSEYLSLHRATTGRENEAQQNRLAVWKQIAEAEAEIAKQFSLQVDVQRSIIAHLKAGKNERSPEITDALAEAQSIVTQITYQQGLIEKYRQQLN
jgi:hypothetical protein